MKTMEETMPDQTTAASGARCGPAPAGYRRSMDDERTRAAQAEDQAVLDYAAARERGEYDAATGEHFGSAEELLAALAEDAGRYLATRPGADAA